MKVLSLTSSILKEFSTSNVLVKDIIEHFKSQDPSLEIIERDLGSNPPAHLCLEVLGAIRSKDSNSLTPEQKTVYAEIITAIDQLKAADVIVIGAPMYNFNVPSGLKNWIDQVCQAGLTFNYSESGPKGVFDDRKRVIIASVRGGNYSSIPMNGLDHQEPYLKAALGLMGLTNVTIIRAEGINLNEQTKLAALLAAKTEIKKLSLTHKE